MSDYLSPEAAELLFEKLTHEHAGVIIYQRQESLRGAWKPVFDDDGVFEGYVFEGRRR